ncbi:acetoacetate decarboxylase [Fusarium denticulatum]|uniref:Acetoacetate decarboxylase n=1 Tax=Fusarium denticulatum TaxID=48507 RepID=A0A8H5UND5_9HYPO|nr:acetoacetate decarboxylase [Fusarium denticulatum]
MPNGTLPLNGESMPTFTPSYSKARGIFTNTTAVGISYRVAASQVALLVPDVLELDDEPLMTSLILSYGMSPVGSYTEYTHQVEVTYKSNKFHYNLLFILDNDAAIFAGRELLGFPKVLGKSVIQEFTGTRLVTGSTERPAGRKMVEFEFVPEKMVTNAPLPDRWMINLRNIPSPHVGQPPSVQEFLPVGLGLKCDEVWTGMGCIYFPRKSLSDPCVNLDILRYEGSFLARNAIADLLVRQPC